MNIKNKLIITLSSILMMFTITSFKNVTVAAELNLDGFNGTMTTTVTSGFSVRAEDEDCIFLDGFSTDAAETHSGLAASTKGLILAFGNTTAATTGTVPTPFGNKSASVIGSRIYGCAGKPTDAYGNTAKDALPLGSLVADDGRLNFRNAGDIVDATQKFVTEISGTTDNGVGIQLSFTGNVNPVLDFNSEDYKPLNDKSKSMYEDDFKLLEAYANMSFDAPGGSFVDVTAGRQVTNWGEATFIPIGMNGLTTNALDLTKLRAPGSSIKEALTPTEQLTFSGPLGDSGVSFDAYIQFNNESVAIDPRGAYFGNDLWNGNPEIIAAASPTDYAVDSTSGCEWFAVGPADGSYYGVINSKAPDARTCNEATVDLVRADTNTYAPANLLYNAFKAAEEADFVTSRGSGVANAGGNKQLSLADSDTDTNMAPFLLLPKHSDTSKLEAAYDRMTDPEKNGRTNNATVSIRPNDTLIVDPGNEGDQFGLRLSGYSDVGNGFDWSLNYAKYNSKVPYFQIVGKQGIFTGDAMMLMLDPIGDMNSFIGNSGTPTANALLIGATMGVGGDVTGSKGLDSTDESQMMMGNAVLATLYGSVCGTLGKVGLASAAASTTGPTLDDNNRKEYISKFVYSKYTDKHGEVANAGACHAIHDPEGADLASAATAAGLGAFTFSTGILTGAITPLSEMTYQFIYPEANEVISLSGSTTLNNGTMVQAEVSYRPDFPLATNGWDQIAQIQDVSGVSSALTMFAVHNTIAGAAVLSAPTGFSESDTATLNGLTFYTTEAGGSTPNPLTPTADTMKTVIAAFVDGVNSTYATLGIAPTDQDRDTTSTTKTFLDGIAEVSRSSLGRISQATAEAGDYNATSYLNYDVYSATFGTTTTFTGSDPIVKGMGADGAFLLTEVGVVMIDGLDNANRGFVARGGAGFNEGSGEYLCLGAWRDMYEAAPTTASTNLAIDYDFGTDAGGGLVTETFTNLGAGVVDALFGNGSYCEGQNGADDTAWTYRLIAGANYFNVNNSAWTLSPRIVWSHDPSGYGPASLGGFSEGRQSLSLGTSLTKSDVTVDFNYVNELGDDVDNLNGDKDYVSASVTYAF